MDVPVEGEGKGGKRKVEFLAGTCYSDTAGIPIPIPHPHPHPHPEPAGRVRIMNVLHHRFTQITWHICTFLMLALVPSIEEPVANSDYEDESKVVTHCNRTVTAL